VALGANTIALTPFGRLWSLSSTDIQLDFEMPYEDNRDAIGRMIEQAHARGLRVELVPHLWIETEGWRGEIDPGSPEGWSAYHASYRRFVLTWADYAAEIGADALSIGVECTSWSGRFGAFWRELISEIRKRFNGPITYSSNWDEVENVLFWDQLDWIGVNAFYPLAGHDGATDAEYVAGAERIVPSVRDLAEVLEMPVVFVEVGYTTRANAAVQPWLWAVDMTNVVIDEREQARALAAIVGAFLDEDWFGGFFLWRYYAHLHDVSQEAWWGFSPHAKLAEPVLERIFDARYAVDPDPYATALAPSTCDVLPSLASAR
jgi:hypothetical protein